MTITGGIRGRRKVRACDMEGKKPKKCKTKEEAVSNATEVKGGKNGNNSQV